MQLNTTAQSFTVSYTLPTGYTYNANPAVPTVTGGANCTLKRGGGGAVEVVYDCDTSAGAAAAGATIRLAAAQVANVGTTALLGTAGNSISMQVKLTENGETACVDNIGTPTTCFVSANVATGVNGVDFAIGGSTMGVAQDSGNTVTDVGATVPLAGFVTNITAPADTTTTAAAAVILNDALANAAVEPDGATDYSMKIGDSYTYTITDPTGFLGLATGGLCLDTNNNSTLCEAGEAFTVSGNTATLTTTLAAAGAPNAARNISYRANGTTPMGTSRTLGIAGSVNVPGVDHALTGNSSWWVWSSNGTQLQSPWFTTADGYNGRYMLMNTGTNAASFTVQVFTETGNTCTLGSVGTSGGTIPAGGALQVNATDICSGFSTSAKRATAVFTINAPSGNIQGTFTTVNSSSGSISTSNLMRPTTN